VLDQALQLAVVAGVSGLQPAAHQLEAIGILEDFLGHRVQAQHLAGFVEHDGRHGQAADGLGIQLAHRLAAIEQVVQVQGTAQMRQEAAAQGTFGTGECRGIFRPGDAKAQLAALGRGNIGAHHMVDILRPAIGLEISRVYPFGFAHQVFNGKHLIQSLPDKRGVGLRVGLVGQLPLAFNVSGHDHQAHVRLIRHPQNQGRVVGLKHFAHGTQGTTHDLGVQRAIVEAANHLVVIGQFKPKTGQGLVIQGHCIHGHFLALGQVQDRPFLLFL